MHQQIQSWPTPQLWVGNPQRVQRVNDLNSNAVLELLALNNLAPIASFQTEIPPVVALLLVSMVLPGPVTNTQTGTQQAAALVLSSLDNLPPITQTQTEATTAALILSSLNSLTPITPAMSQLSVQDAALKLESMLI